MAVRIIRRVMDFETGHSEVPVLVKVAGVPHKEASAILSWMKLTLPPTTYANYRGVVMDALNDVDAFHPETGALLILADGKVARNWFNRVLRRMGCTLHSLKGRYSFEHETNPLRADLMVTAVRKFVDGARELGIHDKTTQHPIEINGYHLLSDAEKAVLAARDKGADSEHRTDSGRYYRSRFIARKLRTEAIFCIDEMVAATEGSGFPEFVKLPTLVIAEVAVRARESVGMCMWGIWTACRFEGLKVLVRNKGRGRIPTKEIVLTTPLMARLLRYIDGERRELDQEDRGLAEFADLGRRANLGDADAKQRMLDAKVFLNSAGEDLTYENLTGTYLRELFRARGMEATLHWARHEYTYNRLREFESMEITDAERKRRRERLASYMGWSSTRMFRIYDAYNEANLQAMEHRAYMVRRAAGVAAAQQLAARPDATPEVPPGVTRISAARRGFMSIGRVAANDDLVAAA